eukprot:CAMPEP_0194040744 /NCGR_PEP_ID=MMETSP0009_2-20130614/12701_1 /TAXON_ID=210454 /ORGANISM="Grammatophora oceanica, Strain CCMP 410" /LENGTH=79 /DNA_ID=CAMNT_0038683977 /DNA_START=1422 /DNA_END=1660 /DNA_ORIENTATION=+
MDSSREGDGEAGIGNLAMLQEALIVIEMVQDEVINWEIGQKIDIIAKAVKDSVDFNEDNIGSVIAVVHNPIVCGSGVPQ